MNARTLRLVVQIRIAQTPMDHTHVSVRLDTPAVHTLQGVLGKSTINDYEINLFELYI